ncbi:Secretory phospholipase A2 receptor [Echinococcus granulosus]|nr:Secretory phospholipase A2 receptor [Echinococcus granulosus]
MLTRLVIWLSLLCCGIAHGSPDSNCIQSGSSRWCFTFYSEPMPFGDANRKCEEVNSSLATVPNRYVKEFVLNYLNKTNNRTETFWIGLHWSHSMLRWISGYPAVVDVFWNKSSEDLSFKCVVASADGLWDSRVCTEPHPFLCSSEVKDSTESVRFLPHFKYECPRNFHLVGRRCLRFFFDEMATRAEAESTCTGLGAYLPTIRSFRENDLLVAMLADHPSTFWLGLSYGANGHWWANSGETEVAFTNWMAGEPSGDISNNCTVIHTDLYFLGKWSEVNCLSTAHFVCEAEPKLVPAHADSHLHGGLFVQGRCSSGFYEYRSACYMIIDLPPKVTRTSSLSSDSVTMACQNTVLDVDCSPSNVGGVLCPMVASPRDQFDAAFLRSLVDKFAHPPNAAWVGLKADRSHVYSDIPKFLESTNLLNYSILNALSNSIVCFSLHADKMLLSNNPCDSHLAALCGYELDARPLLPSWPQIPDVKPEVLKCPGDAWKLFDTNCYRLEGAGNEGRSWHDAELACIQFGGHLTSIASMTEDNFVRSLLPTTQPLKPWIGLKVLIDAGEDGSTVVKWSDDSPVNHLPLYVDGHGEGDEECFQLGSVQGKQFWTRANGCEELAPFVCKTPAFPISVEWKPQGSDHCLPGSHPQFCFSVNHTAVKFADAVSFCQAAGKHVATILDDSQQDFVLRALRQLASLELGRNTIQRYWIGLLRSRGTLHWVSGYPAVPNVYWKRGAEDSKEICVYVDVDLGNMLSWGTANCEEVNPFLCSNTPPLPPLLPSPKRPPIVPLKTSCPLGFLYVNGKCYKVEGDSRNNFTFAEAIAKCSRSGGHLATISSMYEQDIISVLLAERSFPFWIGLNTTTEGRKWANGASITYTNWMEEYPKWLNPRNPLCTYVHNQPTRTDGQWAETACNTKMGFICETRPTEVQMQQMFTPRLFSQDDCASGFLHYRGACYMLLRPSSSLPGRSASQLYDDVSAACAATSPIPLDCEKARGLAGCPVTITPHSHTEAAFMRLLIGEVADGNYVTEVWTGLKILSNSSLDITQTEDRVPLGSLDIDFGHLNNAAGAGYTCFSLRRDHTFLSSRHCSLPAPAICGYYHDTHPLHPHLTNADDFACPTVTERVGRSCFYRVDPTMKMSWVEAEEYCMIAGHEMNAAADGSVVGHLPSVHDPFTLRFIGQLNGNGLVWLGLTSTQELQGSTNGSWIDSQFQWSDGSPVDYLVFDPTTKKNYNRAALIGNLKTCVALDPQSGYWVKVDCFKRLAFTCQFPIEAFPKTHLVSGSKYLPAVKQCPSSFKIETENACYVVVKTQLSAKKALAFCGTLHPYASLASLHSEKEERDLLARLVDQHLEKAYWFGLSQSDLQYAWADSSVVDHISKTGVTVESSHFWHFQDCFTFNPLRNGPNASLTAAWYETNCSAERPFICQVYRGVHGPPSLEPAHPPRSDLPPLQCPQGYRQHEDRCFRFFPTLLSFDDAEGVCRKAVEGTGFMGFLARISNSREQDFVAGLFAAEAPRQPSMAWIGLRQGEKRWTDGTEVTFFRGSLDFPVPVPRDEESMCTLLLYSSNVHFYGLWSRSVCSISDQMYFVCQAVPISPTAVTVDNTAKANTMESTALTCADGYTLGFFNRTALALGESLSPPHCLQLVSTTPMTWQDARSLCKEQSASLPSIDTLADLSFFRAWLQTPRSLGGAGFPSNAAVWLDLRVPACPQCYSNWRWHAGEWDESPVRLTDWFNAPPDPSGCYLFGVAPPARNSTIASHLRSIRPAISCTNISLPVVCQRNLRLPSNSIGFAVNRCVRNPTPELSNVTAFHTNHSVAISGRACIRWDLVQHDFNRSDAVLPRNWRIFTAEIAYSEHASPFWEEHCAHLAIQDAAGKTIYRYACYTSTDPDSGLEDCDMDSCVTSLIPLGWIIFIALTCLALSVGITLCVVRVWNRQRFFLPRGRWLSPIKMTASSSVFGGAVAVHRQQFQQHGVLYSNGDGDPAAPYVRMFDNPASLPPLHSLVPSLTFKHNVYRPLHDQNPLLLDEPDNADEFTGPQMVNPEATALLLVTLTMPRPLTVPFLHDHKFLDYDWLCWKRF